MIRSQPRGLITRRHCQPFAADSGQIGATTAIDATAGAADVPERILGISNAS